MPAEFLPAASLRSIPRLPAARMPAWVSNRLIGMVLWSIWPVISRWERISSLLSGRGRRSSVESHPRGSHPRQPIIVSAGVAAGSGPPRPQISAAPSISARREWLHDPRLSQSVRP